jgi:hypothetical protein
MTNGLEDEFLRSVWKQIQFKFLNCHVGQNLITKFISGLCKNNSIISDYRPLAPHCGGGGIFNDEFQRAL